MPEAQSVHVAVIFGEDPTGKPVFGFLPNSTSLPRNDGTNNYAVIFTLDTPEGATWDTTRLGGAVSWTPRPPQSTLPPPPPPSLQDGHSLPTLGEHQMAIGVHNNNTSDQPVPFGCKLWVLFGGNSYESQDPEIVLDPP